MKLFKFNQKPSRKLLLDPNYFPLILGNNAFLDSVERSRVILKK